MKNQEDKNKPPKDKMQASTKGDAARSARIKQSLRANLQRRKAKARALRADENKKPEAD